MLQHGRRFSAVRRARLPCGIWHLTNSGPRAENYCCTGQNDYQLEVDCGVPAESTLLPGFHAHDARAVDVENRMLSGINGLMLLAVLAPPLFSSGIMDAVSVALVSL
jgi:hypothetical protein